MKSPDKKEPDLINETSKLALIRDQLSTRGDVFVAGEIILSGPNSNFGGWIETVGIIVAPQKPNYDIRSLNNWMDGLISGIKPSARDEAYPYGDDGIHLGKLYFDENLGVMKETVIREVTPVHLDDLLRTGVKPGGSTTSTERSLQRRTWVRPYPDPMVAQIVAEYENGVHEGTVEADSTFGYLEHWITGEQLKQLKRKHNPFERIVGLLK